MKEQPVSEKYHGATVSVNPTMESMRKDECLCLHCDNLKPGQPNHCPIASQLYQVCVRENVALILTRCPVWKPKAE